MMHAAMNGMKKLWSCLLKEAKQHGAPLWKVPESPEQIWIYIFILWYSHEKLRKARLVLWVRVIMVLQNSLEGKFQRWEQKNRSVQHERSLLRYTNNACRGRKIWLEESGKCQNMAKVFGTWEVFVMSAKANVLERKSMKLWNTDKKLSNLAKQLKERTDEQQQSVNFDVLLGRLQDRLS